MKREMVSEDRGELPVLRACQLLKTARSGYYRSLAPKPDRDAELRERVIELTGSNEEYGYRRITAELHGEGRVVNRKRVLRVMRENDCLCTVRAHRPAPNTTDSNHDRPVYHDLTRGLELTAANQLWVADISYLPLVTGRFVYIASVMDAWSRRIVGWEVMAVVDTRVALSALDKALAARDVPPGLIHHSDRGCQYASEAYTSRLLEAGIAPSMGRRGHPRDNAKAESFFATLKCEHVHRTEYENLEDARQQIAQFIDRYNGVRRHSALGYTSPERFEAARAAAPQSGGDRRRERSRASMTSAEHKPTRPRQKDHRATRQTCSSRQHRKNPTTQNTPPDR